VGEQVGYAILRPEFLRPSAALYGTCSTRYFPWLMSRHFAG